MWNTTILFNLPHILKQDNKWSWNEEYRSLSVSIYLRRTQGRAPFAKNSGDGAGLPS
jgi:hypothetical protein